MTITFRMAALATCMTLHLFQAGCGPSLNKDTNVPGSDVKCVDAPAAENVDLSGMPDFTLDTHDGMGSVDLHSLAGKKVVAMSFWSTLCDPCMLELPLLEDLYQKYEKCGFTALAISMDTAESVAEVPACVDKLGLTFPVLLDPESEACALYNTKTAAPFFLLFDRTGKQVYSHEGFVVSDVQEMEHQIRKALGLE
jgi:peroxiredoxin